MFTVVFYAYCGMETKVEGLSRQEAIERVARRLKNARRHGLPIRKLGKGEWEIETPDDAAGVSDFEGILSVRKTPVKRRKYFRV